MGKGAMYVFRCWKRDVGYGFRFWVWVQVWSMSTGAGYGYKSLVWIQVMVQEQGLDMGSGVRYMYKGLV